MLKCGFGTYIKAWQVTGSRQRQNILSLDVFWKLNVVCAACIYNLQAGWFRSSYSKTKIWLLGLLKESSGQQSQYRICCFVWMLNFKLLLPFFFIAKWACYYTNNIRFLFWEVMGAQVHFDMWVSIDSAWFAWSF